ncbi:MAG: type I-B CRISPR-associated protein Cas7/Csh2 [Planctomycetota bacterium]|nr:MAG: type I-B CRISPR-associated protein Cas7/Csh2 [Planctomycetota bacterium]
MPFSDRFEYLFLYEVRDCNPNGDPLEENRPRTDPETGQALVSDARIKRTIRDAILAEEPEEAVRLEQGIEILIRDTHKSSGYLSEGKDRAEQFVDPELQKLKPAAFESALQERILSRCIDARLFGTTLPTGAKESKSAGSLKVTGPVQFMALNRSLHRVTPLVVQQTAAFAGSAKAKQRSFAERHLLPYAAILVTGVANEAAARTSTATEEDLDRMESALWTGTRDLATTSKLGHAPLLLLRARYEAGTQLGALGRRISVRSDVPEDALRGCEQFVLDLGPLLEAWTGLGERLRSVRVRADERVRVADGEREGRADELLATRGFRLEE